MSMETFIGIYSVIGLVFIFIIWCTIEYKRTHKCRVAVVCKYAEDFDYFFRTYLCNKWHRKYPKLIVTRYNIFYQITDARDLQGLTFDKCIVMCMPENCLEILTHPNIFRFKKTVFIKKTE